jgi:hypothetical protein
MRLKNEYKQAAKEGRWDDIPPKYVYWAKTWLANINPEDSKGAEDKAEKVTVKRQRVGSKIKVKSGEK